MRTVLEMLAVAILLNIIWLNYDRITKLEHITCRGMTALVCKEFLSKQ